MSGARDRREGLVIEEARGAARRAGLRAGDCIVALNDRRPEDVLDLEMAAADDVMRLRVLRQGRTLDLVVRVGGREGHGIALAHGIGARPRECRNACRFCFVDQLPQGLRGGLYVKDDDYRLSFLHGTFITLTNLSPEDVERIAALRLSPLYVSLHAWDDKARVALMGPSARRSVEVLSRLLEDGLEVHVQVVVCPGWNDRAVLADTVVRLAAAGVEDVGLVPVSLATEGDLRRVASSDAETVVATVEEWQKGFRETLGRGFVHAADEFHLLCGRFPPSSDAGLQYENGIGMAAQLLDEARELAAGESLRRRSVPALRLLGGGLVGPVLEEACARLARAGVVCRAFLVANELFGAHVTVTGLLGGRELIAALGADPLAPGEWLLAPRDVAPADLERTLDDVPVAELARACDGRLVLGDGLTGAFATLTG